MPIVAGSLTVVTTGDSTDEPDGSVTAALADGRGYDLGASKPATVDITDDDPPATNRQR